MGKISISIDEQTQTWLDQQAGADVDAYVNELIRKDQQCKAAETELCQMLDEAEASGFSERSAKDIWAAAEAEYLARRG